MLSKDNAAGAFVKSIGRKLSVGADMTGRAIKSQTLKAEIMIKENSVKSVKSEFGVHVYEFMEKGDQADTSRVFNEYKAKIDTLNADIASKRLEIQELEKANSN